MSPMDLAVVFAQVCCILMIQSDSGHAASFHCSRDGSVINIRGETEGDIYTLYEGDTVYQNNQKCEWMIDAGAGYRVEITVVSSNLQWAPASAICPGYDHVSIKDVSNETAEAGEGSSGSDESIVLIWCGNAKPLGAVSSGRYLKVEFMSDKNNPYSYSGAHLQFQTFASTECAPSWAAPPGGDVCFKLLSKATDWSSAQRECNAEHSNLASFTSEEEFDFVVQTYGGSSGLTSWIGLNDIAELGSYTWIDGEDVEIDKFAANHRSDKYKRCVTLQFQSREWHIQDCVGFKSRALCNANKGRQTQLFAVPQETEDDNEPPSKHLVAIGVSVGVLVILVIIGVIAYRRCKRQAAYRQPKSQNEAGSAQDPLNHRSQGNRGTEARASFGSERPPIVRLRPAERGATPVSPSAPPVQGSVAISVMDPSSQMIAPPTYEDAVRDTVNGSII